MRIVGFLLFASTLYGLMHLFVERCAVRRLDPGPAALLVARLILFCSWLSAPVTFACMRYSGALWADLVQWMGYAGMGFFAILFGLVAVGELLLGIGRSAARLLAGPIDPARRALLERAVALGGLAGAGALGVQGLQQAAETAEVLTVELPVPGLAPALDGFRVAQLSDIHVGPTVRGRHVQALVDRVQALKPDLVALTGDLVDGSVERIGDAVRPLHQLRATHGVYFVTGNHEYYSGAAQWMEFIRSLGITVLTDEHRVIQHGEARMIVAGVPDITAARMVPDHLSDPALALSGAPEAAFRLLLAHQPRSAFAAAEAGFDLMLCGHTHGGQIFPYTWLIHLAQPFAAGLHWLGRMAVYVNRGATWWGPPMRVGSPHEITLIILRAA